MRLLYELLKEKVQEWKKEGYKCQYPEIQEIFEYENSVNFLRKAQIEALEHYWYVRLILNTPKIEEVYRKFYQGVDLLETLGIPHSDREITDVLLNAGLEGIFTKIKEDDDFVKRYQLEGLRETFTLKYPSYILALSMGAGKTILIASIIATEFAMAMEYSSNEFVKNALVFAPGKTILGALREISYAPYEKILPPRFYKRFITNVKFTYTRDGEKDIPVIGGSFYNVIVTNTEKIRLTKESITKGLIGKLFRSIGPNQEEAKNLVVNQRLKTITSLPSLAVFSDEAHHTYGQKLSKDLKRVRRTIDYIAEKTNLVVVLNTTGTPYYQRKVLRDVIYWYGLLQGIKDGVLKDVRGNIVAYKDVTDEDYIREVVNDFTENYWNITIEGGAKAKLAIYFPQIEDIEQFKPIVEQTLINKGIDPVNTILEVHSKAPTKVIDLFENRINDPSVPYRIFLLVNKGTEGWNCLSLFATALARELRGANNFCLQTATRCLRQVPFNRHKAKIYLSERNVSLLDSQLRETYGETLFDLSNQPQDTISVKLFVKKTEIPPIVIKRKVFKVYPKNGIFDITQVEFNDLKNKNPSKIKKRIYDLSEEDARGKVLKVIGEKEVEIQEDFLDVYSLAVDIADIYRLDSLTVLKKLRGFFKDSLIPMSIAMKVKKNIEKSISNYEIKEEIVEEALALLKLEGFEKDENTNFYTEIRINKTRFESLLLYWERSGKPELGFHYNPYNFDSNPEKEFFLQLLRLLNEDPDDVEDIYFTGAITSRGKTDFIFEYKGEDGTWHPYTPDFLIRKKDGRVIIVEVKGDPFKDEEAEKVMKEIEELNPDKVRYELLETDRDNLKFGEFEKVKDLVFKEMG